MSRVLCEWIASYVHVAPGPFACFCISSNPAFILIPFSPLLRQIISPRTTVHLVSPLQLVKQRGKSVKNQSACIKGPCWLCIGVAYGMSGFPFCICDSIVPVHVHVHPAFCVGTLKLKVKKRKATQEKASGRNNDVVLPHVRPSI